MNNRTKRLVIMGMFIALSFVGAYIKIPSPMQSIALDSMPAYLGGMVLGGVPGGIIGFIGHMLTSANVGFPLSLPVHLIIGIIMFISVYAYSITYKMTNIFLASAVGIVLNGAGAPLVLTMLPQFGWGFFVGIAPFLILASAINIIVSSAVFKALEKTSNTSGKGFGGYVK